ncbi:programmed cell death 2 C-terminal domain-containing protein [Raphanus sativus]|uniref:Probable 20S rRNA accumulation protein 4 n=1 Tax=Raphanus sativus TaxID=3726 RepID=A0A6J0P4E9_RAPSA|nr:probable 20S rRNA accumulation protein 4 [Raphanus sativus]KAJ4897239.1 programmed cell death 2 C-terminal domain-containing protein [Raphanus sativus]
MVGILLGLPGQWAEDELESSDHYTTKIGGLPDWPPLPDDVMRAELLNCTSCGSKLSLVAQVYAPISTENSERTLYIFGCLMMPKCGASEQSWRALSVQKAVKEKESIETEDLPVASPKDTPSKPHWLDDGDDDDDEDFDFESLAKAIAEAATTVASNSKKPKSKPSGSTSTGTKAKPSPLKSETRVVDQVKVETGAVLPCFYIYTKEEKVSIKDVDRVSVSYSSMSIKDKETSEKKDESEAEEAWEDEKYEYDKALNADRTYLKFQKRLDANSEQCFRYSYGGKPLLATEDLKSPEKCRRCDSPMVFEMQLMSPLIYFLHEAVVDEGLKQSLDNWDWMTLIVYTCSKSCATSVTGDWIVAEGCIAVQKEKPMNLDHASFFK